jgi:hypothetical protein
MGDKGRKDKNKNRKQQAVKDAAKQKKKQDKQVRTPDSSSLNE